MAVKKTIQFRDLDNNLVEQDWYFSLGKTDALEMDLVHRDDVAAYLEDIMRRKDSRQLLSVWKELLFRSVGKRVGNLLVKNEEVFAEFRDGGAYEQFFSDLIESEDAGASFFLSILPDDIQAQVKENATREYSKEELLSMSDEEFFRIAGRDETQMSREHLQIAFNRKSNAKGSEAA